LGDAESINDIIAGLATKQHIMFCAASGEGDAAPLASEDFFAFPFVEDFIDQQTPAEHKHLAMSRFCGRFARYYALSLSRCCALTFLRSSVVAADRTLKPDSQVGNHLPRGSETIRIASINPVT
jgi:hypothetical protein